jgi:hypothetical protein
MRRALAALSIVALALAPATPLWAAAGTATVTEKTAFAVQKIVWSWTAGTDAEAGTVTKVTSASFTGKLIGLTTIPAAAGDAPTDDYDITITDSASHDVLLGAGANRDTANTEHVAATSLGAVAGSPLTLNVSAAGASKKGTVILWIR